MLNPGISGSHGLFWQSPSSQIQKTDVDGHLLLDLVVQLFCVYLTFLLCTWLLLMSDSLLRTKYPYGRIILRMSLNKKATRNVSCYQNSGSSETNSGKRQSGGVAAVCYSPKAQERKTAPLDSSPDTPSQRGDLFTRQSSLEARNCRRSWQLLTLC